jgi:Carboxypeptidase regulatory-like domain
MLGSPSIMAHEVKRWFLPVCALALVAGCGSDAANLQGFDGAPPTVDADATPDVNLGIDAGSSFDGGAARTLSGAVTDQAGAPVVGAKVESGTAWVYSDGQGLYTLGPVDTVDGGSIVVTVNRDWFEPFQVEVDVGANGTTHFDVTLTEMPLYLDPADVALANAYNATFDWTKQTLSIAIAETPTRRNFDNAVYWQNPALYRDTSAQAAVVPAPLPQIVGGTAMNLSFPIRGGTNDGKEALDLASVVDSIASTPVAAMENTDYMLWTPMLNWLTDWNAAKSVDLKLAGVAVRQQNWGSNAPLPQDIRRVFLDATNGALWVEVVFQNFVQLGDGITDDDGDGYKEIFAKVDSAYVTQEILDKLVGYGQTRYTTHGMSDEVTKALRELYSSTSAQVVKIIGQPFDILNLGTIQYPFVVLQHAHGQVNVILMGP